MDRGRGGAGITTPHAFGLPGDGSIWVACGTQGLKIFDAATGTLTQTVGPRGSQFARSNGSHVWHNGGKDSLGGPALVTNYGDGHQWDLTGCDCPQLRDGVEAGGHLVLVGNSVSSRNVWVYDASDGSFIRTFGNSQNAMCVAVVGDDVFIVTRSGSSNSLWRYDIDGTFLWASAFSAGSTATPKIAADATRVFVKTGDNILEKYNYAGSSIYFWNYDPVTNSKSITILKFASNGELFIAGAPSSSALGDPQYTFWRFTGTDGVAAGAFTPVGEPATGGSGSVEHWLGETGLCIDDDGTDIFVGGGQGVNSSSGAKRHLRRYDLATESLQQNYLVDDGVPVTSGSNSVFAVIADGTNVFMNFSGASNGGLGKFSYAASGVWLRHGSFSLIVKSALGMIRVTGPGQYPNMIKSGLDGEPLYGYYGHSPGLVVFTSTGDIVIGGTSQFLTSFGQDGFYKWRTGQVSNHIAIDASDNIYLVSGTSVRRFNGTTGAQVWSVTGVGNSITVDSSGNPYTGDGASGTARRLNPADGSVVWESEVHAANQVSSRIVVVQVMGDELYAGGLYDPTLIDPP